MSIEIINAIIAWLKVNYLFLVMLGLGAWYGKRAFQTFIFDPLAGGNGKVQMDELAKGVLLGIVVLATYVDGHRIHEWTYFSDAFYAILLAAVCGIAAIQPAASILKSYFTKDNKDEGEPS